MKVTVYMSSAFGITKMEGTLLDHGYREYAQYKNAPFITLREKRKREARRWHGTFRPYFYVVEGWNNPDPPSAFDIDKSGDFTVKRSRYASFDPGYVRDFDEHIANGAIPAPVVFDHRWTQREG